MLHAIMFCDVAFAFPEPNTVKILAAGESINQSIAD